jgi:hypothetical protein
MKWHIICLVTILSLYTYPVQFATRSSLMNKESEVSYTIFVPPSDYGNDLLLRWSQWLVVGLNYAAFPGRVMLCRWQRVWRRSQGSRKRRRMKKSATPARRHPGAPLVTPIGEPEQVGAELERVSEAPPATKKSPIPLRMVLRPGVMLTGRRIQLRPMIARLGDDVDEYRALWKDRERFKATIRHLLNRPCPLCKKELGFRCIGSGPRSVIPPGSKDREWFRVQKVECQGCKSDTRVLPTFCIPFKSHHAQTIQNVLENCWRRNNSYRDTTAILNQSRPPDGQYRGHTLPYEWTIWLGGLAVHLPQLLVWLGFRLLKHSVMDEYFMEQDNGTDHHRIFAVTIQDPETTVQDPETTVTWNILRVDRNDTEAFKQTLQQLKDAGVRLRAITSDGWPAILRAVREELSGVPHLLCYFHAKKNVFETLEKYRKAQRARTSRVASCFLRCARCFIAQTLPSSPAQADSPGRR